MCFFGIASSFRGSQKIIQRQHLSVRLSEPSSPYEISSAKSSILKSKTLALLSFGMLGIAQSVLASSLEESNNKLSQYDLPPIIYVPPGFTTFVNEYGRGSLKNPNINPVVVQFCHPSKWIQERVSVNNNGESGKVAANDYIKGDSAFMYVSPLSQGQKVDAEAKQLIGSILLKSVTQKGDVSEAFKVNKITPGPPAQKGEQSYFLVDFSYKINTEAGFLISRKGVASITSLGPNAYALVALTTDLRYKTMETALRDISYSFRVNKLSSGVFAS